MVEIPTHATSTSPGVKWPVLAAALLQILMAALPAAADQLDQEWLRLDRISVQHLLDFERESGIRDGGRWDQAVGASAVSRERRELGFGAVRLRYVWIGGYSSASVEIIDWKGTVVAYRLSLDGSIAWREAGGALEGIWAANGGGAFTSKSHGLSRAKTFGPTAREFEDVVADRLGPRHEQRVPHRFRHHYAEMLSPFSELEVGLRCGYGATESFEWRLIRKLVRARRVALLADLLRGYNPEGRLMAALGLRDMDRHGTVLPPGIRRTIEEVVALPIEIRYCSGCIGSTMDAASAVVQFESELAAWGEPTPRYR